MLARERRLVAAVLLLLLTGVCVGLVQVAAEASWVYWADEETGTILRCSADGPFPCAPEVVAAGQTYPRGVAVDADNSFVYLSLIHI